MDIKEFRQKYPDYNDIPDMELAQKLHAKDYGDLPFETFAKKFGVNIPSNSISQKPSITELATEGLLSGAGADIEQAKAAAQDIYRTTKEPIEYAGLIGGGLVGASGGPLGSVAGAGLGYAGAKRLTQGIGTALGVERPETPTEVVTKTAKDIVIGGTAEAFGQLPIAIAGKMTPLARRLYESALKPVPSIGTSERNRLITIGLENAVQGKPYRPSEKQVYQLGRNITNLVETADDIVKEGAKTGDMVQTQPLIKAVDDVITDFRTLPFPKSDIKTLNELKGQISVYKGKEMPANKALAMKKKIYQIADRYYKTGQTAVIPAKAEAEKAVARAIKTELETLYPATAPLNKEASKQIEFGKVLERAANRAGNREIFGLFDFLGVAAGSTIGAPASAMKGAVVGGLWGHIASNPQMKAKIAKEIMKAQVPYTLKKEIMTQIMKYGTTKAINTQPTE